MDQYEGGSVTVEGNIGAGKNILFQKFEESLSSADRFKIRVEHEPLSEFQSFYGNKVINTLEKVYEDPVANALIFKNYVLDV